METRKANKYLAQRCGWKDVVNAQVNGDNRITGHKPWPVERSRWLPISQE